MTTIDIQPPLLYREATDRNGRNYRIGETDRDIMGRPRWTMVLFPWMAMMGISSAEYAFTSAEDTRHEAHTWSSGHIFWLMGGLGVLPGGRRLPGRAAARERLAARPERDDGRGGADRPGRSGADHVAALHEPVVATAAL
jgi:hypothetical protein